MLFVYLLSRLGVIDKEQTTVRPKVLDFAFYSLLGLILFILLALSGLLDRL